VIKHEWYVIHINHALESLYLFKKKPHHYSLRSFIDKDRDRHGQTAGSDFVLYSVMIMISSENVV
jgi:hypothetical protein